MKISKLKRELLRSLRLIVIFDDLSKYLVMFQEARLKKEEEERIEAERKAKEEAEKEEKEKEEVQGDIEESMVSGH